MRVILFLAMFWYAMGFAQQTPSPEPSPLPEAEAPAPAMPKLESGTSTELILDASGSMKAKLQGKIKLTQAKRVLHAYMVQAMHDNVKLGLRVYGLEEKNCQDSKLVLKFGETGMQAVDKALDNVDPKGYGKTPLAYSLEEAAKDLAKQPEPRRIVVVTDGLDTCQGDPCKVAKELKKKFDVKIYVVGYTVSPEEQQQLKCIGDQSGGAAFTANDTSSLFNSLSKTSEFQGNNLFVRSPDPLAVVKVFKLVNGQRHYFQTFVAALGTKVPPGLYRVEVTFRKPYVFPNVSIAKNQKKVLVVKGGGILHVEFLDKLMTVEVQNLVGAKILTSTTDVDIKVPTGYYKLKITSPPFSTTQIDDVSIFPMDYTKETVDNFGVVRTEVPPRVSAVPLGFYVYDEKKKLDVGSYVTGLPVVLPVGTYTFQSTHGISQQQIDVVSRKEAKLTLNPAPKPAKPTKPLQEHGAPAEK